MSARMPTVCDLVSVCVFRSGSSHPLTYRVLPAHTAPEMGRTAFEAFWLGGSGISVRDCAEALEAITSAAADNEIRVNIRCVLQRSSQKYDPETVSFIRPQALDREPAFAHQSLELQQ